MIGAKIVELPKIGHLVMAEAPDETLAALTAFLPAANKDPA